MTVFIRRFCFDNFLCCIFHLPPHCSLARGQHLSLREAGGWAAPSPGREGTFVVAMGVVRRPLGPTAPPTRLSPIPVLRPGPSPPGKGILHPSWPGVPLLEGRNQRTVRREHQQFPTLSPPPGPLPHSGKKAGKKWVPMPEFSTSGLPAVCTVLLV